MKPTELQKKIWKVHKMLNYLRTYHLDTDNEFFWRWRTKWRDIELSLINQYCDNRIEEFKQKIVKLK